MGKPAGHRTGGDETVSERRARAALSVYRLMGTLAYPMLGPYVAYRAKRGKEDGARRRERYGEASSERPGDRPLVWVHAASVGETAAVTPLVRAIAAEGIAILMTTGTRTSAEIVEKRLSDCVIHQYVPLDVGSSIARFLDHWRPDLALFAESELWPVTIEALGHRRIPQVLVNARLSDRSFDRWKRAPWFAEALLEHLACVVAQSDVDAERYRLLGAPSVTVAGNLKADTDPPACDEAALHHLAEAIGHRPVWGALSTHSGEEEAAAACHISLKRRHEGLLTVIVPRHVERGAEIAKSLSEIGLGVARRSLGERPTERTDILIGDTIGEMGLYLRLAPVAFLGKSLTGEGGQNPLEAAMLGTAILSGRYVQNFRDIYQRLLRHQAAIIVRDEAALAQEVDDLLSDGEKRAHMAGGAQIALGEMRGALDRTMRALTPFINPLKLSMRLDRRSGLAPTSAG